MPPLGEASACSSSGRLSTRQCGVRVAAHSAARSTACGVAKRRSKRSAWAGAPCSSIEKIDPPSSLTTTIVRSGSGSPGPSTSPLASCRNVTSPMSARARLLAGRPSAAPIAVDTTPSMPDSPRLATTLRRAPTRQPCSIRSRSRIGLEAPTCSSPSGGRARATAPATSYGVRPGSAPRSASSCRETERSAASQASSQAGSAPCWSGCGAAPSRWVSTAKGRSAHTPRAGAASTSTSSRPSSRVTGRLRVGCPATTTRSMLRPRSVSRSRR